MWRQERDALLASPPRIPHHLPLSPHLQITPADFPRSPPLSPRIGKFRDLLLFQQRRDVFSISTPSSAVRPQGGSRVPRSAAQRRPPLPPRSARARESGRAEPMGTGPLPPLPRRGGRGEALPDKGRTVGASSGTCPRSSSGGGWEPARSVTSGQRGSHRRPVTRWDEGAGAGMGSAPGVNRDGPTSLLPLPAAGGSIFGPAALGP